MKAFYVAALPCLILVAVFTEAAYGQNTVKLSGRTRKYATPKYLVLGNANISIYRNGPVTSDKSDGNGDFDIDVPAGVPFRVVFVGPNNYLPELQSLTGEAGVNHRLDVCLLTVQQAQKQGIDPYKHVEAVMDQLAATGVPPDDAIFRHLQDFLRSLRPA